MKERLLLLIILSVVPGYNLETYAADTYLSNNDTCPTNWTTCESFLENTTLDLRKVIDVDWKIFYFWNINLESSYHVRFSVPSPEQIERLVDLFGSEMKPQVNWNASEMFMETSTDVSGLLIRLDTPGLFRFIPALIIEFSPPEPVLIGIKEVEGYLGIVNCQQRVAYALAPVQHLPNPEDIERAAAKMEFWNPFARSYLFSGNSTPSPISSRLDNLDDADDEVDREIERFPLSYQMF